MRVVARVDQIFLSVQIDLHNFSGSLQVSGGVAENPLQRCAGEYGECGALQSWYGGGVELVQGRGRCGAGTGEGEVWSWYKGGGGV